ncbi:hypothetical protein DFO66_103116 [Brevibacterium sanguinis]|uniref:Uncharacterized protein n=2 Tax=Brevibacterium TaxID=1696 RepID=A0A366IK64_9MICO|nr:MULTISPECIES: hypothetical protein [Brevibacterium]RBP66173.1 hypothetical protein DFO66_103116 [Brevibacterium sanguinis]RBP72824.1 hypothetical protein DFO65_103115 [Brevibacterium celere]
MILAQTPAPTGAPDPDLVTPGTIGFLVTLFIVILVIFLIRDALKRVRRVRARSAASDAYPIPLRKHAVPNQSKLSGAKAPEDETTAAPGRASDARQTPDGGTDVPRTRDSGPSSAEADDRGTGGEGPGAGAQDR